ncbi:DUF6119 family protein [Rhizobium ruizarguesonis]
MSKGGNKSRSFSIYLLKSDVKAPADALNSGHALKDTIKGNGLPDDAVLYVLDTDPKPIWWTGYFGLETDLKQMSKGALVFLPVKGRWFALSFGHVGHYLDDEKYEHDFGLRVTLNAVDPDLIRSTDILQPSGAKRQRIQLPAPGDLTLFDFDQDSTILKSLTGKVKDPKLRELFRNVTGAANVRISTDKASGDLAALCATLLDLYGKTNYTTTFPALLNVSPVRDPAIVGELNNKLLEAIHGKDDGVVLTVPEIQDFNSNFGVTYAGAGAGKVTDDANIADYFRYLEDGGQDLTTLTFDDLKKHRLLITSDDGSLTHADYKILRCLLFDADYQGAAYHLREGQWYEVKKAFIDDLKAYLDPKIVATTLPTYNHASEGAYNKAAATSARLCLDTKNIAPAGQKAVEPCDLFEVVDRAAVFHHIKLKTLSGALSHLFNQGVNSVWLLGEEPKAMTKLKGLLTDAAPSGTAGGFHKPLENNKLKLVFGVVTTKDPLKKSANLPLFSRISLRRAFKDLSVMRIEAELCFIPDGSPPKAPRAKTRKPRAKKAAKP